MFKLYVIYLSSEKFFGALEGYESFFPRFVLLVIPEMKISPLLFTAVVVLHVWQNENALKQLQVACS